MRCAPSSAVRSIACHPVEGTGEVHFSNDLEAAQP